MIYQTRIQHIRYCRTQHVNGPLHVCMCRSATAQQERNRAVGGRIQRHDRDDRKVDIVTRWLDRHADVHAYCAELEAGDRQESVEQ